MIANVTVVTTVAKAARNATAQMVCTMCRIIIDIAVKIRTIGVAKVVPRRPSAELGVHNAFSHMANRPRGHRLELVTGVAVAVPPRDYVAQPGPVR